MSATYDPDPEQFWATDPPDNNRVPDPDDPRLRFRVWIDGKLADEVWVDASDPDSTALIEHTHHRHEALTDAAARAGNPWLIEVYDPAEPEERAYCRFGSDLRGMIEPVQLGRAVADVLLPGAVMTDPQRAVAEAFAAPPGASFTCPRCGRTSHHPTDVAEGYCGACHAWTRDG